LDEAEMLRKRAKVESDQNGLKGIAYYYNKEAIHAIYHLKQASEYCHDRYPEGEAQWLYFLGLAHEDISNFTKAKNACRKACACEKMMGNSLWHKHAMQQLDIVLYTR
jgi:hypothetical protein